MIRQVDEENRGCFFAALESDPLFGGRIATAFDCYAQKPGLCRFYLAGSAALLLQGGGALLCGRLGAAQAQELAVFLRFCGVGRLCARAGALPGLGGRPVCALVLPPRTGGIAGRWPLPAGIKLQAAPSLWALRAAGLPAGTDPDGWYADACIRTGRGLARVWTAEQNGRPVATAGLYSLRPAPQGAYLAAVETLPAFRGQGIGHALTAALADSCPALPVRLLCTAATAPFYRALGFKEETEAAEFFFCGPEE